MVPELMGDKNNLLTIIPDKMNKFETRFFIILPTSLNDSARNYSGQILVTFLFMSRELPQPAPPALNLPLSAKKKPPHNRTVPNILNINMKWKKELFFKPPGNLVPIHNVPEC